MSSLSAEVSEFNEVMRALQAGTRGLLEDPSPRVFEIYERTAYLYQPIRDDQPIAPFLPGAERLAQPKPASQYLYLSAIEKGSSVQLPVLTWTYDFEVHNQLSLFVTLFQLFIQGDAKVLRGLMLRYEMPHQPGGGIDSDSDHNYYHVQITLNFDSDGERLSVMSGRDGELCPPWLSVSFPALPLPAAAPAELLVCLLVSLYGFSLFSSFELPVNVKQTVLGRLHGWNAP